MAYSVKFTGFETEHQAKTFADWYSGQGEQQSGIWLEEHSDIIYAITESFSRKPDDNGEIQVPPCFSTRSK